MYLVTSDLHLTDKPLDAYRFGLFDYIENEIRRGLEVHAIFILGDLTDEKDNHSSKLVNAISSAMARLSELSPVYILKGNHDYIDSNLPFFSFLNRMENVRFISDQTTCRIGDDDILFLPHSRDPRKDWIDLYDDMEKADYIFLHQTLQGSKASNGMEMEGLNASYFDDLKATIISGDIHVPQKVGPLIYCGSPYRIRYGDSFEPRLLYVRSGPSKKIKELHFPCLRKHTIVIRNPQELFTCSDLKEGDQVKVRLKLAKADVVDWQTYKQQAINACEQLGLHLHGVELILKKRKRIKSDEDRKKAPIRRSVEETLNDFCTERSIDQTVRKFGREILNATRHSSF